MTIVNRYDKDARLRSTLDARGAELITVNIGGKDVEVSKAAAAAIEAADAGKLKELVDIVFQGGVKFEADATTPRQIKEATIQRAQPGISADLHKESDDYVNGVFRSVIASQAKKIIIRRDSISTLQPWQQPLSVTRVDSAPAAPRQDAPGELLPWQQPLSAHRDARDAEIVVRDDGGGGADAGRGAYVPPWQRPLSATKDE